MSFTDITFIARFLPIFLAVYYIAPNRWRDPILFIGSLIFYAFGEPRMVFMLLLLVIANYLMGRVLVKPRGVMEEGLPELDENGNIIKQCYDKWDIIENVVTNVLDGEDSAILLKLIQEHQAKGSPVSFRVENVVCPECGKRRPFIPIDDIGQTLLFQLSRRFGDIKINLNKTALK